MKLSELADLGNAFYGREGQFEMMDFHLALCFSSRNENSIKIFYVIFLKIVIAAAVLQYKVALQNV